MTTRWAADAAATSAWAPEASVRPDVPTARPLLRVGAEHVGCRVQRAGGRGTIHSVFRQACNIETAGGALVTLLIPGAGNLPHGIRCSSGSPSSFEALLRPGQAVLTSARAIQVPDAALSINLSGAHCWSGEIGQHRIDTRSTQTRRRLAAVRSILKARADDGFAPILLHGAAKSAPLRDAMAKRLAACLPRLAIASAAADADGMAQALQPLVGLGPGLTPSGDDFIVGYLAALWCQSAHNAEVGASLAALAPALQALTPRTNLISRQFLVNAVEGQFSERLVDVVCALARPELDLSTRTADALRTGHSSGADSLVGLLFGLLPESVLSSSADAHAEQTEAAQ